MLVVSLYRHAAGYRTTANEIVVVEKGTGVRQLARQLQAQRLIVSALFFELQLRFSGQAGKIKAGEYEILAGSTPAGIAALLASGRGRRYSITIPEGYNIHDVCRKFSEKNLMPLADCQALVLDTSFLREPQGIGSLEGYLFPNTYFFEKATTPRQMIQAMVNEFYAQITPERLELARSRGLTLQQWVTLASLIEKETGVAEERPLIAGVFFNRLRKGMLLQTDPTVIYGVKNFNGNLTKKDLQTDTPYNTYTRAGLPVGPIANPGLASLLAAIEPYPTEAYYFVAKGLGRHYFAKTLDQHNRAVQYFQLKTGTPPSPGEEEKFLTR